MIPTCIVPMRTKQNYCKKAKTAGSKRAITANSGMTLTELVVVLVIMALLVSTVQLNIFGLLRRKTFEGQVQEFVSTLQMVTTAAAESDRRYEIIINLIEQSYTLREIISTDMSEVMEDDIIVQNEFGKNCRVVYVMFDDLTSTNEEYQTAKFRLGRAGWQYGGKIVLIDDEEQAHTVVINRINRTVRLEDGDAEILMPKAAYEISF